MLTQFCCTVHLKPTPLTLSRKRVVWLMLHRGRLGYFTHKMGERVNSNSPTSQCIRKQLSQHSPVELTIQATVKPPLLRPPLNAACKGPRGWTTIKTPDQESVNLNSYCSENHLKPLLSGRVVFDSVAKRSIHRSSFFGRCLGHCLSLLVKGT